MAEAARWLTRPFSCTRRLCWGRRSRKHRGRCPTNVAVQLSSKMRAACACFVGQFLGCNRPMGATTLAHNTLGPLGSCSCSSLPAARGWLPRRWQSWAASRAVQGAWPSHVRCYHHVGFSARCLRLLSMHVHAGCWAGSGQCPEVVDALNPKLVEVVDALAWLAAYTCAVVKNALPACQHRRAKGQTPQLPEP
jgi:hypothetical protein